MRHAWIILVKEYFRVGSGISSTQKARGGGGHFRVKANVGRGDAKPKLCVKSNFLILLNQNNFHSLPSDSILVNNTEVHWVWFIQTRQLVHSDYEVGAFRLSSWCIQSGAVRQWCIKSINPGSPWSNPIKKRSKRGSLQYRELQHVDGKSTKTHDRK